MLGVRRPLLQKGKSAAKRGLGSSALWKETHILQSPKILTRMRIRAGQLAIIFPQEEGGGAAQDASASGLYDLAAIRGKGDTHCKPERTTCSVRVSKCPGIFVHQVSCPPRRLPLAGFKVQFLMSHRKGSHEKEIALDPYRPLIVTHGHQGAIACLAMALHQHLSRATTSNLSENQKAANRTYEKTQDNHPSVVPSPESTRQRTKKTTKSN